MSTDNDMGEQPKILEEVSNFYLNRLNYNQRSDLLNEEANIQERRLQEFELNRIDSPVKFSQLVPQQDGDKFFFRRTKNNGQTKDYYLTREAMNQFLMARKASTLKLKTWETMTDPLKHKLPTGETVEVDTRKLLLNEIIAGKDKDFFRVFRESNASFFDTRPYGTNPDTDTIVTGIVGKSFPLIYSDHEQIKAVNSLFKEAGINYKHGHTHILADGSVNFSWYFTDSDMVESFGSNLSTRRALDRGIVPNNDRSAGMFYSNNFSGRGSLSMGNYYYQEICSNGMKISRRSKLFENVAHATTESFLRNIINNICTFSDKWIQKFEENTKIGFDLPKLHPPEYYIDSDNIKDLYPLIARGAYFRVLNNAKNLQAKYLKAAKTILKNWRYELLEIKLRYRLADSDLSILTSAAVKDDTIKLNLDQPEVEYSAIIDVFTSTANYYAGKGSLARSAKFQEIGGDLLTELKPITPLVT